MQSIRDIEANQLNASRGDKKDPLLLLAVQHDRAFLGRLDCHRAIHAEPRSVIARKIRVVLVHTSGEHDPVDAAVPDGQHELVNRAHLARL